MKIIRIQGSAEIFGASVGWLNMSSVVGWVFIRPGSPRTIVELILGIEVRLVYKEIYYLHF